MAPTTPLAITVRVARNADLAAIGNLWEQLMEFHVQRDPRFTLASGARQAFLRHLSANVMRSPDCVVLVAETASRVVGFLAARVEYGGPVYKDPHFGYITDLCVDEAFRRRAVGRELFQAVAGWFRSRGLKNIRVSIASANPVSTAFWKGLGFRPFMERLWLDLD